MGVKWIASGVSAPSCRSSHAHDQGDARQIIITICFVAYHNLEIIAGRAC